MEKGPEAILEQYWGFTQFRGSQKTIIEAALNGNDVLGLLPTGGGKSICFQVPTMMREGICIVVSPLVALIQNQVEGLKKTGIEIENIPSMYGMNRILKEIGWAAVAVDGFIPPNAFMEFQAYNTLVIASDIRTIDHIEYTPAPDIIHEAAGHAPIIANPEYAEYLRYFGEIGSRQVGNEDPSLGRSSTSNDGSIANGTIPRWCTYQ